MGQARWFKSATTTGLATRVAQAMLVIVLTSSVAAASSATEWAKKPSLRSLTTKTAAKQFLADDAPFAAARTIYGEAFTSWEAAKKPFSATASFVEPFLTACQAFEHRLDSQKWPSNAVSDVRIFAKSLIPVRNDVAALPSLTSLAGGSALAAKLARDSVASRTDSNDLRRVLGLPLLSS
jgi:hypothetical protein